MESLIRTFDRQGLLKGDISYIQHIALQWLMTEEIKDDVEREKRQAEILALASNPATNPELIKSLFPPEAQDEGIEWVTPQSQEELEDVAAQLGLRL